jgi:hypothetical protein
MIILGHVIIISQAVAWSPLELQSDRALILVHLQWHKPQRLHSSIRVTNIDE